jgi:hypothetical protein
MCSGGPAIASSDALNIAVNQYKAYVERRHKIASERMNMIDAGCCARISDTSSIGSVLDVDVPDAFVVDIARFHKESSRPFYGATYYISTCGKVTDDFVFDHERS